MKTYFTCLLLLGQAAISLGQELKRDNTFNNDDTTANGNVRCIAMQADQKIVFFGDNSYYNGYYPTGNGIPISYGGRLNKDGSWDATFNPLTLNGRVDDVQVQDWDQKILIGGSFTQVNGIARTGIARLNTDGTVDMSFNPGGTGIGGSWGGDLRVWSIAVKNAAVATDRRIFIGGQFEQYNGTFIGTRGGVAALFENGSRDMAWNPLVGSGPVYTMLYDNILDKLYIGGEFWKVGTVDKIRLARLNANGTLDNAYSIGAAWEFPNQSVTSMALTAGGKLLMGGYFTAVKGITSRGLARLNTNGTVDMSFNTGLGFQNGGTTLDYGTEVRTILTLGDGSIIAGGNFRTYNGVACPYIVKLEDNGTIDTDTTFGTGFNEWVMDMKLQNYSGVESRIVVGGCFNSYQAHYQGAIMRLFTAITLVRQSGLQQRPESQASAAALMVYPNPVSRLMRLRTAFTKEEQAHCQLFDITGRLVKSWNMTIAAGNHTYAIGLPGWQAQYLLLRMTDDNGKLLLLSKLNYQP